MPAQTVVPITFGQGGPRTVSAFIVTGDRPFLVDTGTPGNAPAILGRLDELGIPAEEIALIVITHAHPDHAGSAADLQVATNAPVLAQRMDAEAMDVGASEPVAGRTPGAQELVKQIEARRAAMPDGPIYPPVQPGIIVDDEHDLASLGIAARVIHTPGHTRGGLTVLLGNGEAITGDLVGSEGADPRVPALAFFATDEAAMQKSIAQVLVTRPSVVHTCHDGSFTLAELQDALGYLTE